MEYLYRSNAPNQWKIIMNLILPLSEGHRSGVHGLRWSLNKIPNIEMKQDSQLIKKVGVLFSFPFFVFYIFYVARKVKTRVHSQKSITKIWNCTRLKTNFLRICLIKWPIKAMPYLVWVSNPLLQHPVPIRLRYLWAQVFQINKFWTNCLVCGAQTVNSHRIPDFTIALRLQIQSADIRADRNHLRNTLQQILNNKPEYICLPRISGASLKNI